MLNIHLPTLQGTITDYQLVTTEEHRRLSPRV